MTVLIGLIIEYFRAQTGLRWSTARCFLPLKHIISGKFQGESNLLQTDTGWLTVLFRQAAGLNSNYWALLLSELTPLHTLLYDFITS